MLADKLPGGERTLDVPKALTRGADREGIYRQILFHGPAMQAIRHVEGSDDRSIAAWVSTSPPPASWLDRPLRQNWLTDPLAIDAAFQVVVLWTRERLGANSLPTAVGSYRQFRGSFPADGVRVLAVVRQFSDHRAWPISSSLTRAINSWPGSTRTSASLIPRSTRRFGAIVWHSSRLKLKPPRVERPVPS